MTHISSLSFLILSFTSYEVCVTQVASFECGTINYTRAFIWYGKRTDRGEWPFLTALFKVQEEEENEFFCGGSLISSKHVLTAAHCIQDKSSSNKRLPGEISVLLGAYDLTSKTEIGVQQRNVKAIHVHPEWDVYTDKYDADLAVLLLSEIVIFTDYIRPVCIPADDTVIDDVRGSVVGWGLTELGTKPNTEFIKRTFVTAQNGYYCLTEDPGASVISSPRTFCGRGEDGNANRGDSGGGFYVENQQSVWVQHGIVSALRADIPGYVDADSVVLYTNVAKFKTWIVDTVMQSGAEVGQAKTNVELNLECSFGYSRDVYACFIYNLNIRSDNIAVASISGSHLRGKSDNDVEFVQFRNGTMYFIPSGVGQIFKKVKRMHVAENLGTKRIKRSDFESLEELVRLEIFKNDITTLDYDSFRDLKQLEVFVLQYNRLTEIEEGTFQANTKLKKVVLAGNKLEVLPRQLFRNNSLLEFVNLAENSLKLIDELTFETNSKLQKVGINANKLEVLPRQLFRNNLLLDEVHLGYNALKIIDESTFETNRQLQKVGINGNKLEVLPSGLFRNNLLLEEVNLGENSLKLIDESTFETNSKLHKVGINANKLEVLARHLFRNNLLLHTVGLNKNSLKIIEVDFTSLKNIKQIDAHDNICVNAYYTALNVPEIYFNEFRNLTEFNSLIRAHCSSTNTDKYITEPKNVIVSFKIIEIRKN